MEENTDLRSTVIPKIEPYTKLILGFTASCYAIGIFVVNIFYGKYGFYSLSLFRISYVIAGFWAILVLAFIYLFFRLLSNSLRHTFGKDKRKKEWIRFLLLLAFIFGVMVWIPTIIAKDLEINIGWNWFFVASTGCIGLAYLSKQIKDIFTNWSIITSDSEAIFNVLFGVSLLVGYLVSFSASLFPDIPANIGGGRPQQVQLVISNSFKSFFCSRCWIHFYGW